MLLRSSCRFESLPSAVAEARRFTQQTAEGWAFVSSGLLLVVGELATNAVTHVGCPFKVALACDGRQMTIEVTDASFDVPIEQTPQCYSPTGRGLKIVTALSSNWGVRFCPSGKVVWAEMAAEG